MINKFYFKCIIYCFVRYFKIEREDILRVAWFSKYLLKNPNEIYFTSFSSFFFVK